MAPCHDCYQLVGSLTLPPSLLPVRGAELPPASELSSATSLLVVVFDVCDRAGLEAVSTLPEAPWHKPLLVGNKVDQEYWRSIKGEPPAQQLMDGRPQASPVLVLGHRV